MPLYEYECQQCHRHTEKIQKFSDPEITACPHCGGALERVISAPAIAFKGGGWYADGYGSRKPASSGESKSGDATSTQSKGGETKSDTSANVTESSSSSSKDSGATGSSAASSSTASSPPPGTSGTGSGTK